VETLSGKTVAVMLEAGSSVPDLKSAIYAKEGVSVEQQLLVSAGRSISSSNSGGIRLVDGANVLLTVGLRGGGRNKHKGKRQQFTHGPIEELEDPSKAKARERWQSKHGGDEDEEDEEEEEEEEEVVKKKTKKKKPVVLDQYGIPITDSEESEEEDAEEEEEVVVAVTKTKKKKKKPVVLDQYGIPITDSEESEDDEEEGGEATNVGAPAASAPAPVEVYNANRAKGAKKKAEVRLTRRERDELEAQEAAKRYQKKHAAGMTDEAKADKARLAVVRQRRADAAKKKEEEAAAKALAGK